MPGWALSEGIPIWFSLRYCSAMPKPLRVGLLGTGVAARELYAKAFNEAASRLRVVACANRTKTKALAYARAHGIPSVVDSAEELIALPEVDAVIISLPIDAQPEYVLQALRAGKPVLSEKPVAPSVLVGRRLLKSASKYATPWLVGENFAFMSHVAQVKRWLDAGRLGEVRLVQVNQISVMDAKNPYYGTSWRAKPKHVGGFVVDGGVHVANVVRRCFGMPTVLTGLVAGFEPKLPPIDTAISVMRFESGALGTWTSCFSAQYDGPLVKLFGSHANVELFWDTAVLSDRKGRRVESRPGRNSFTCEFEHFADMVLKGRPPLVSPEEALLDLEFVERICKAERKR